MKRYISLVAVFFVFYVTAQSVTFNKIEQTHQNGDRFLYKIETVIPDAIYLGEIEVQGFSKNDAEIFGKVYKKAKEIGANAFRHKPFDTIEGGANNFNPHHYKISLYYLPFTSFPKEINRAYLFSSSDKAQTIEVNNEKYELKPRTYKVLNLIPGQTYHISTRKLFGSSINIGVKEQQPEQYFLISSFKINSGSEDNPGLKLKSGDIIGLEKSYAQFLSLIHI